MGVTSRSHSRQEVPMHLLVASIVALVVIGVAATVAQGSTGPPMLLGHFNTSSDTTTLSATVQNDEGDYNPTLQVHSDLGEALNVTGGDTSGNYPTVTIGGAA